MVHYTEEMSMCNFVGCNKRSIQRYVTHKDVGVLKMFLCSNHLTNVEAVGASHEPASPIPNSEVTCILEGCAKLGVVKQWYHCSEPGCTTRHFEVACKGHLGSFRKGLKETGCIVLHAEPNEPGA